MKNFRSAELCDGDRSCLCRLTLSSWRFVSSSLFKSYHVLSLMPEHIVLGYGHKNRKDQYPCHAKLASRKQQNLESSPGDQPSKNL